MLQPDVRSAAVAARPEQPSGFTGCRNITLLLIILLSSAIKRRGERIGFRAKFACSGVPLLCDLIPLLFRCSFRCYSAVNSAVNSTVSAANSSRKYLNQRMFWSWIFAKKRLDRIFFPR